MPPSALPVPVEAPARRLDPVPERTLYVARAGLGALPSGFATILLFMAPQIFSLSFLLWAIWWPYPDTAWGYDRALICTASVSPSAAVLRAPFIRITLTDRRLLWTNLRLLMCVSFIPFPTAFFSEYPVYQTSLVLYATSLMLVGLAQVALWRYLSGTRGKARPLLDPALPAMEAALIRRRGWAVPTVCALAIAFSFVSMTLARCSLLLIPAAIWLFTRGLRRSRLLQPARPVAAAN